MLVQIEPIESALLRENRTRERSRLLVCVPRYLPGYKSGGPIRSVSNMVNSLSQYFDCYVVTRDRDATDVEGYPGVVANKWHRVGNASVLYCSTIEPAILREAFNTVRPDVISLNSFQDTFTRIAMRLRSSRSFGDTPVVLAPRGEFSPEAMAIKKWKKNVYRRLSRILGLHENLFWQVSTPREKQDLLRAAPARRLDARSIHITRNISDTHSSNTPHVKKDSGMVRLTVIARMSEMKNIHFLLEVLQDVQGKVQLNLFGPVAENDISYWGRCREFLEKLPDNITAKYHGALEHSAVPQVLHDHHFFVLPTRGENFCHSAVESFINSTPVVLSDATPWLNLNGLHAGFDIPLSDRQQWVAVLQRCVDMDQQTYSSYLSGASEYGKRFSAEEAVQEHLAMFQAALASTR
jgi:glycosyltransferase involved in cell wall biosynthesis